MGVTDFLRALLEMRQAVPLSWSPDGSRLLVASNVPGTHQLYEVPGMRQLTSYDEPVSGRFLPDGRVLVEVDEGGNERTQLHVLGEGQLVSDLRYIHRTPYAAADVLAYSTNRRNEIDFDIVVRTLSTGEERVFEMAGNNSVEAISPDGRFVVVDRVGDRAGDNDLFVCDVESGEVSHLTPHDEPAEFYSPVWTPGGVALSTCPAPAPSTLTGATCSRSCAGTRCCSSRNGTSTSSATTRDASCSRTRMPTAIRGSC